MNDAITTNEAASDDGAAFEREAYLSLADEFDPMGATTEPTLDDFDTVYVEAARRFASRHMLPLPWEVRSMDNAIRYVETAERAARVRDRQVELGLGPDLGLDGFDR